jgi:hypothetical protein
VHAEIFSCLQVDLYFGRTVEEGATYQEGAKPPHLESFLAVKDLVAELGLPFRDVQGDTAILTAPAGEFRRWVLETGESDVLQTGRLNGSVKENARGDGLVGTAPRGPDLKDLDMRSDTTTNPEERESSSAGGQRKGPSASDGEREERGSHMENSKESVGQKFVVRSPVGRMENASVVPLPTSSGRTEVLERETLESKALAFEPRTDPDLMASTSGTSQHGVSSILMDEDSEHTAKLGASLEGAPEGPSNREDARKNVWKRSSQTSSTAPFVRLSLKREKQEAR